MSLEKEIIQLLEQYRDTECGGKANKAAEALGVTPATFSRWLTGSSIPKVESLIRPFERLNARIETAPKKTSLNESPLETTILKNKIEELERLLSAKEKIIKLQEELLNAQKSFPPQEQDIKRGEGDVTFTDANEYRHNPIT